MNVKKDKADKEDSVADQTKPAAVRIKSQKPFGHFDSMKSGQKRFSERGKPGPLPRGGRNGQGKPS